MEDEEVEAARMRVDELRKRVWERNLMVKALMDELIALLDDLNMADNVKSLSVQESH